MTPAETARVLAKASAFDQRTVGQADVLAWHEALADLDFADAMAAVTRHYADHTERIMPAHIRRAVVAARNSRPHPHEVRELPSRYEEDAARNERLKRGLASVRDVLGSLREQLEARRNGGAA